MMDLEDDESKGLIIPLNRRFWNYWQRDYPGDTSFFDYATGSFVWYFPKRMKPSTLQNAVMDIYDQAYTHKNILSNIFAKNIAQAAMGINVGYGIRKMNKNLRQVIKKYRYMEFLESVEKDLYDENEVLIEEKLDAFKTEKFPLPLPMLEEASNDSYAFLRAMAMIPVIFRIILALLRKKLSGKKGW